MFSSIPPPGWLGNGLWYQEEEEEEGAASRHNLQQYVAMKESIH